MNPSLKTQLGSGREELLDKLRKETPLGRQIAAFVGIDLDNPKDPAHKVPPEMAFTHFRNRIGPVVYEAVFHWNLALEKNIRKRWKHFHEEDELLTFLMAEKTIAQQVTAR